MRGKVFYWLHEWTRFHTGWAKSRLAPSSVAQLPSPHRRISRRQIGRPLLDDRLITISDFSAPGVSAHDVSTFVHELAHVWQFVQWGGSDICVEGATERKYEFALHPDTQFLSLKMEQQAMVVQNYYLMTHGYPSFLATNSPSLETVQSVISQICH